MTANQNSTSSLLFTNSRIVKKLLPGQSGTKRLLERFGKQLLCVRYRLSANGRKRLTTVEIVVSERDVKLQSKRGTDILVAVRIPRKNLGLSRAVWEQGGVWDPVEKVWWVHTSVTNALGITNRIVQDA
ncbi:MAG: hypothetical protein JWN23_739 [Rhodocyclales bacterium]|nr:hypothetical protein [Rhodocyclales bacterium]